MIHKNVEPNSLRKKSENVISCCTQYLSANLVCATSRVLTVQFET